MVSALASLDSTAALCSQPVDAVRAEPETPGSPTSLGRSWTVRTRSVRALCERRGRHPFGRPCPVCEEHHSRTGRPHSVRSRWAAAAVPETGFEPASLTTAGFKPTVSTRFHHSGPYAATLAGNRPGWPPKFHARWSLPLGTGKCRDPDSRGLACLAVQAAATKGWVVSLSHFGFWLSVHKILSAATKRRLCIGVGLWVWGLSALVAAEL